ncbi:MAG: ComF family protein [Gammaproteobacteria bacterium]|nr:ComF family protein [Gammaproteobacteria bacterium]
MKLNHWLHRLVRPLFPATCILCGAAGEGDKDICSECLADLPWIGHCCQLCALPLQQEGICGACLQQPPAFDRCISPLLYQGPVPGLITGLKFHHRLANARLLAWLMLQRLQQEEDAPELILPIPLHPQRLRERGYNQSLEIARPLAQQLCIGLSLHHCARSRATSAQSELPKKQRQKNLRNAFVLQKSLPAGHIALLDDVVTTGSTVNELARLLKKSGVERVDVWAVARTP